LDSNLFLTDVDEGQIGQVIRNLVLNARDAMPNGGVVRILAQNATITSGEVSGLPPGNYVLISVIDEGHGIPPEVLPKIFDPYFSTKQRGADKGMGLGLSICHTIIRKHEGTITVKSQPGVGTTFQFYLPAREEKKRDGLKERHAAVASPPPPCAVLVMDDEECMRFAVGTTLERRGFQVGLAKNGQEAIDSYIQARDRGCPFDVVILDLTIRGGMGGKETIEALLKIDPTVKAIVMSGYSEDPALLNPERYGFKAGMDKSFDVNQLTGTIARVVGDKYGHETIRSSNRC
jgi:CheY-like chemotaxis protein